MNECINRAAKYNQETRDWYVELLKDKDIEEQIYSLELTERKMYNYYCDCSDRWTSEQNREYESKWNEVIEMIKELREKQSE